MFSMRYLNYIAPFALIVLCIASARFLSPVPTLVAFIFTLAIYILLRYDSRLFVGTAIFLLILSAGFLAGGSSTGANEIAITAYYFLVIGVLDLFIEYLREGREAEKKERLRKGSCCVRNSKR